MSARLMVRPGISTQMHRLNVVLWGSVKVPVASIHSFKVVAVKVTVVDGILLLLLLWSLLGLSLCPLSGLLILGFLLGFLESLHGFV